MDPHVSVIVPAFAPVAGLTRAIDSALAQSLPPLEVIVIDDGSMPPIDLPDRDPRVRLERLPVNRGPSAARNLGSRLARGDWIAFLDADDLWLPDKLARQLTGPAPRTDVLIACNVMIVDGSRRPYNHSAPTAPLDRWILVEDQSLQTSGLVLPRTLALRFPFDERLRVCEDWDLVLRLDAAGVGIDYCADCLSIYPRPAAGIADTPARSDAIIAWLTRRDGAIAAETAFAHYAHHLLLPHLKHDVPAALRTLYRMGRRLPNAPGVLAHILWRKLRRMR